MEHTVWRKKSFNVFLFIRILGLGVDRKFFDSILLMNKEEIEYSIWQKLQDTMRASECVNYILSLSSKESIQQADREKLNKIKDNYDIFYRNAAYDTSINGVVNINSLALSYIEFIK